MLLVNKQSIFFHFSTSYIGVERRGLVHDSQGNYVVIFHCSSCKTYSSLPNHIRVLTTVYEEVLLKYSLAEATS
jgi:hypothetical protein